MAKKVVDRNNANDYVHHSTGKKVEELNFGIRRDYGGRRSIYNDKHYLHGIYDSSTGEKINLVGSISDSIRLSGTDSRNINDTTTNTMIKKYRIPTDLLGTYSINSAQHFNAKSCINALGLYVTDYIDSIINHYETDIDAVDDPITENELSFRNYIKGGAAPRNVYTNKPEVFKDTDAGYDRLTENLGIGLGEAFVLNPQFQFNKRDDVRTNPMYCKIGRIYSTRIMNNWPIVLFQPGRLKYHTGFFKMLGLGSGAGITESLIRTGGEGIEGFFAKTLTVIGDIVGVVGTVGSAIFGGSKVCEFKQSINLYQQYLRFLLNALVGIMGLNRGNFYSGSIKHMNLTNILPTVHMAGGPEKHLNNQYIPFRCSKDVIGSESFSNSTNSNPLMDSMNQKAQENAEGTEGSDISSTSGIIGSAAKTAKRWLFKTIGNFSEQAMVLSGRGRINLPNVFSSSSFSRTFNCNFKFHYPYGDRMGKFENLYLPYMALLAMTAPRQTGKLSYTSPFNVRIFVKNQILINFGMIESLSVTRGGDANDWGPDGFPKTLSVDLTVQDMEPNITLPMASRGPLRSALEIMFPATGMSEYLSSLGGLSLDQMNHHWRVKHLKRSSQMFIGTWAAKLDPDNIASVVANVPIISNVLGLFNSVDLDHYNELGDIKRMNAYDSMKSAESQMYMGSGGFLLHSQALNGTESQYKNFDKERAQDSAAIDELAKESLPSFYN